MKTLIVYASKHGTAKICAEYLADLLRKNGNHVDIIDANQSLPEARFDAIVLGSGIYAGKILSSMATFCEQNSNLLLGTPLCMFACGMNTSKLATQTLLDTAFPRNLSKKALYRSFFGGKITWDRLSRPERAMLRMMKLKGDTDQIRYAEIEHLAELIQSQVNNRSSVIIDTSTTSQYGI